MHIESHFDFIADNAIRIKATRVGIETVLRDFRMGATPEEIVLRYPTLSLEQVYVTITYYLLNREKLEIFIDRVRHEQDEAWQNQRNHPSEFVRSLRKNIEYRRTTMTDEHRLARGRGTH